MLFRLRPRPFLLVALLLILTGCDPRTDQEMQDGAGSSSGPLDVTTALDGFVVAQGLTVAPFATEPLLVNPTNIDVDARGRVWVLEARNYRPDYNPNHDHPAEGDRILILEDTDGDGQADQRIVYYQGQDVNAALGIAVLGNKVIVSCSPNVFVFTDDDGDDRPDRKELLFTGVGGLQDDHGIHAFTFGPDGRLYFNYGNAGHQLLDAQGQPVVDRSGRVVRADGAPYRQGMVFSVNPDGSDLDVLGHNFRNIYEVAVDAYGTLWQSDNDDDGNRAVRINYVMPYGNYGYQDERTGENWRTRRTGMHPEVPKRHWHLNDPGVVPNLLETGAGSPTGIVVYEGRLLPEVFWDQMIHADAGPNVVRAYPVRDDGAGYAAEVVDVLTSPGDQWFRPSDVAVAPDGSLIVADWYDAVVGGNQQVEVARGRLFRIAPPGAPYHVPPFDLATDAGAVAALVSPNMETRYLAWMRLAARGEAAEAALRDLWAEGDDPRHRARALWLLGRLPGKAETYVDAALAEADANLRIVGLRLAQQQGLEMIPLVRRVVDDASPQVRREAALALRHHPTPEAAGLWAALAQHHDGHDRWYLEALGIAAEGQWDLYFAAWQQAVGKGWDTPGGRDLIWRARTDAALPLLAALITDPDTGTADRNRYFRAFDFHDAPEAKAALAPTLFQTDHPDREAILILALQHLVPPGPPASPEVTAAVAEALQHTRGTQAFLDLVARFEVEGQEETLAAMAFTTPDSSYAIDAVRTLLAAGGEAQLQLYLAEDPAVVVQQVSRVDEARARAVLEGVMADTTAAADLRREAAVGLVRTHGGQLRMLELLRAEAVPSSLRAAVAPILQSVWNTDIQREAQAVLGLQPSAGARAAPRIWTLVNYQGDADAGAEVFAAHCQQCHVAAGQGTDFGPALDAIGTKLSKEGLYTAIIHPSAGIAFGYEGVVLTLRDGSQAAGYITSDTPDVVALRLPTGETRRLAPDDIVTREALETSLMPALHQAMTQQELIDLVEYLHTLSGT